MLNFKNILTLLGILAIFILFHEKFAPINYPTYYLSPSLFGGSWPIYQSTRFTRNQSYDIRGDPYLIPPGSVGAFYNSPYADIAYAARSWQRPLNNGY